MARALLLLPSTTYRAGAYLAAARRLGVEVVTGSDAPQTLATVMGDRFLELDPDEPERAAAAIAELGRRLPLDAVLAVDDRGALAAAAAARLLGLAANPPEAVAATLDKGELRRLAGAARVVQPAWRLVPGRPRDVAGEQDDVVSAASAVGYPVVVKPVSLSGSRGVVRADDPAGARAVARRVRAIATRAGRPRTEPLLVEAFVAGEEVAFEGILRAGRLERLALFDKPDPLDGPYFEETIYVTPSALDGALAAAVGETVRLAAAAIGLTTGPVHAELRLAPRGAGLREPVLLELASRTIGGRCSGALAFADGSSLEEIVLAEAVGAGAPAPPLLGASGVLMVPIPRSGLLVAVHGVEDALALEAVTGVELAVAPGRPVHALPEGDRYLGFVFARAGTAAEVVGALRAAKALLAAEVR